MGFCSKDGIGQHFRADRQMTVGSQRLREFYFCFCDCLQTFEAWRPFSVWALWTTYSSKKKVRFKKINFTSFCLLLLQKKLKVIKYSFNKKLRDRISCLACSAKTRIFQIKYFWFVSEAHLVLSHSLPLALSVRLTGSLLLT